MRFSLTAVAVAAAFSAPLVAAGGGVGTNVTDVFKPARATDQNNMSPCPFMNALNNHGVLPYPDFTAANITTTTSLFGLDAILSQLMASNGIKLANRTNAAGEKVLNLHELSVHNGIEHDASLTRSDAYFGDQIHVNRTLYNQMKSFSSDGVILTKAEFGKYRKAREADSKARNPEYTFGLGEQFTTYTQSAFLWIALKHDTLDGIRLDWLDVLVLEERFPFELGYQLRKIELAHVLALETELRLLSL
ncbi:Chloroperoxidase [Zopfochytrium polystomum]|nr:Chloroperoxidase [Zopfochytrium polystomum]